VPFLDMAYQGFGEGIAEDGAMVGLFMTQRASTSSSPPASRRASRSYGERVGAQSV
jgi:aromatic-amino-acid transaminase